MDSLAVAEAAVAKYGALQKVEELAAFLDLAEHVRPKVVLEIGSDAGGTLYAWAQLPSAPRVISVNLPAKAYYNHTGGPALHGAELIEADSQSLDTARKVRAALGGQLVDILFIDADHTYGGVARDYALYSPLVRPGGLIAFHDVHDHKPGTGVEVARLWRELTENGAAHTSIICRPEEDWGGIGILTNAGLPPRSLQIVCMPANIDGSSYHRLLLPFTHVGRNTRHMLMMPKSAGAGAMEEPDREALSDVEVIVLQRPAFPPGMQLVDKIKGACAIVYESDDDILSPHPSALPLLDDPRARESIQYCLRAADMVTVSTPYLAEKWGRYNGNVAVLPNVVDGDIIDVPRTPDPEGKVVIGYGCGSSHLADMISAQDALIQVLDDNPQALIHFAGVDFSPVLKGRPHRFNRWTEDKRQYYKLQQTFDIGIAPLAPIEFNRSKSDLKWLDYGAMGIPLVAQDMEPYRDTIEHGVNGFLCRTEDDWVKTLTALINDQDMREEVGRRARRQVREERTIQGNWQKWAAAYESVAW